MHAGSRGRRSQMGAVAELCLLTALALALAPGTGRALSSERVASGLASPVLATAPPRTDGGAADDRLFLVELGGTIQILDLGTGVVSGPFLDLSGQVSGGNEQGLLGLAFAPDFATSGAFYVYYTAPPPLAPVSTLSRFRVADPDDDQATGEEKVLLQVTQPFPNHNGGTIAFGPDGMLYLGLGDGGGAFDPQETAQRGTTLLGKLLRLDVSFSDFDDDYAVPPDNPFAGVQGPGGMTPDQVLDEIWALGLRNPFRFSFDRETGDLYMGDVGQDAFEEIDVEPAPDPGAPVPANPGGRNYGWDLREGRSVLPEPPQPGEPNPFAPALTDPVFDYAHDAQLCSGSVTGGAVYRGDAIPSLRGQYFFADFCMRTVSTLVWDGAGGLVGDAVDRTAELAPDEGAIGAVTGFGEDARGELYIVDVDGEVFRLVPEPGARAGLLAALLTLLGVGWCRRRRTPRGSAARAGTRGGAASALRAAGLAALLGVACVSPAPERLAEPAAAPVALPEPASVPEPGAPAPAGPHQALVVEVRGKSGGTLYLLGSVHVGDREVGSFRPGVLDAWQRADALVVEVHPDDLSDAEAGARMLERALLPESESLADRLPPDVYEKLGRALVSAGMPPDAMDRFEPWFAGITLATLAMVREGYAPERGVDRLFMEATPPGKEVVALETLDGQLDLFEALSDEVQVLLLRDAVESAERLETDTIELVEAWKRGDPDELEAILFADLEESPELAPFYDAFFFERNLAMSERLAELLAQERVFFAVVGVGHVVGDRGIAALLGARGYAVRRIP